MSFCSVLAHTDVSIAKISSFKRMREFTDKDLIVEALRESPELLQVSEDGLTVRRKSAVVPTKDHFQRSIYAVSILVLNNHVETARFLMLLEFLFVFLSLTHEYLSLFCGK